MKSILQWLLKYGSAAPDVIAAIRKLIDEWNESQGLPTLEVIDLTDEKLEKLQTQLEDDIEHFNSTPSS